MGEAGTSRRGPAGREGPSLPRRERMPGLGCGASEKGGKARSSSRG